MGLKIKEIRESRGIGQKEAADLAGMKVRTYGSYERGERSISLEDACKLADVFECTLDELAGREWPHPAYADPRQEAINAHYSTFNDDARQDVYKMVERMSLDPDTRIELIYCPATTTRDNSEQCKKVRPPVKRAATMA